MSKRHKTVVAATDRALLITLLEGERLLRELLEAHRWIVDQYVARYIGRRAKKQRDG